MDSISISSLDLLNKYRPSFSRFTIERLNELASKETAPLEGRELSAEEIMRVAAACFVRSSIHSEGVDNSDELIELIDPFVLSKLTQKDIKWIDLAMLLLAAAKNLSNQHYDVSSRLLTECYKSSSSTGTPVERVVHYFSQALQEKIDNEMGVLTSPREIRVTTPGERHMKAMRSNDPTRLDVQQKLPFSQLVHFISVQTIIDNVASSKRIHVIDMSIKHGVQWATLMQALATRSECPVDRLTITAIGSSETALTATGKMLASFAETQGISFDFKTVIAEDMRDVREEMFQIVDGETVAVYSSMDMSTMIVEREGLENLIRVLQKLKPCIMTVADVDAKLNSSSFVVRFTEALFYFSTVFDYLDGFMDGLDVTRRAVEGGLVSQGIRNIIATEGSQRVVRHVGINVWRLFFARFELIETELSEWSLYQANYLLEHQFEHGTSCSVEQNGKSLILGWKGSPLLFVSAWKFVQEEDANVSTT